MASSSMDFTRVPAPGTQAPPPSGTETPVGTFPQWGLCLICNNNGKSEAAYEDKNFYVLPCLHTLCSNECLLQLKDFVDPLACPKCKVKFSEHSVTQRVIRPMDLLDKEKVEAEEAIFLNATQPGCPAHRGQDLTSFCETCEVKLCNLCISSFPVHNQHQLSGIPQLVAEYRMELYSSLKEAKIIVMIAKSAEVALKEKIQHVLKTENDYLLKAQFLLLLSNREATRKEVTDTAVTRAKLLNIKRAKLNSLISQASQYNKLVRDVAARTSNESLLEIRSMLRSQFKKIKSGSTVIQNTSNFNCYCEQEQGDHFMMEKQLCTSAEKVIEPSCMGDSPDTRGESPSNHCSLNRSHPSVIWAQRKNCVFLTICLEDVKDPEIRTETGGIYFKGKAGTDGKEYESQLDLFGSVDPTNSMHVVRPRNIEFCLKKEEESFWPRLMKSQAKCPWLKIDFNKWKDEDESDEEQGGGMGGMPGMGGMGGMGDMGGGDGTDFEEMMRQIRGLGGAGGMPGMDKPGSDDLRNDQTDSDDDEDMPDLE